MPKPSKAAVEARRALVLEYTLAGLSVRRIAEVLLNEHDIKVSHTTVDTDRHAVLAEITKRNEDGAVEMVAEMDARYRRMLAPLWTGAARGDKTSQDQAMKIMDRMTRLHGLEKLPPPAPPQVIVNNTAAAVAEPPVRRVTMEYPDDYDPTRYGIQR